MTELAERLQQLQDEFAEARIPTGSPGFYEEPAFVRRERKEPTYLDNYARFVQWQPYSSAYLETAEEIVYAVAAELQLALHLDESPAAYAETPLVLSRILEREGIWNFVVHGALTITLPPGAGFKPVTFWSADVKSSAEGKFGRTWVYAPPFKVVDITLQAQDYPYPITHMLPKSIMEKATEAAVGDPADILSPAALAEVDRAGLSREEGLDRFAPTFCRRIAADFSAQAFVRGGVQFKYVPTAVIASDASLEQFQGFVSKGRSASQVYTQEIRPRLAKQ